uniref:Uncharacterized protein n=1 Tax=Oryza barthii TaxID=65489 RepID=A0A0D3GDW0_9ORYZ
MEDGAVSSNEMDSRRILSIFPGQFKQEEKRAKFKRNLQKLAAPSTSGSVRRRAGTEDACIAAVAQVEGVRRHGRPVVVTQQHIHFVSRRLGQVGTGR